MTDTTEGEENEEADGPQMEEETTQKVHLGTPAAGEYSFRLFPVGDSQEKRAPFPLPAPFDKRLPGDRRSFALMQNKHVEEDRVLHLGGIFPIEGKAGWQGGQVCHIFFSVKIYVEASKAE